MNKILVTGSDGLVGTALKTFKKSEMVFINRSDVDLTNYDETSSLFKKIKPTQVIHLAAAVGGIGGNLIHSGEYFRNNININMNVLESSRLVGVSKLLCFMSTCVFPDKCEYPLQAKNLHNGPPHPSNFGYAYAKRMLEVQCSAYRKEWGCNYIVGIPSNIYGPGDNFSLEEGHVLPALIHRVYKAKTNNESLNVWGSGEPLREFIYSNDIAKLSLWALENYNEEEPLIMTSGIETSIREAVDIIVKHFDFKNNVIFDSSKPDGQYRKPSDTSELNKRLPNFKWKSVQDGICETVDWFQANYPKIRL
jgi:GDP-L-fucose synthase